MTFSVAEECVRLGLRAGAIVFRDVRVGPSSPALREEIGREAQTIQARLATVAAVRALPTVAGFEALLQRVGVNPRKDQPSLERLLGYAVKRADLPAINNLVDAYNLVSVRSGCSLGAHDLDKIACPVALRLLTGTETFTPLGRATAIAVTRDEYGYVDAANRVLCRLDVLQAEFSKVMADTTNVLLIIEGTAAHATEVLRQAFADTIELVTRHCGGSAEVIAFPQESCRVP